MARPCPPGFVSFGGRCITEDEYARTTGQAPPAAQPAAEGGPGFFETLPETDPRSPRYRGGGPVGPPSGGPLGSISELPPEIARVIAQLGATFRYVTDDRRAYVVGMPDGSQRYINVRGEVLTSAADVERNFPAPGRLGGLTLGEEEDFRAATSLVLRRLGVVREATEDEILLFAKSGLDVEGIADYYRNLPELVERQPGLPFGLGREEYGELLRQFGESFRSVFGGREAGPEAPGPRATRAEREGSLVGQVLRARIPMGDLRTILEEFRQARGRAPGPEEFREFTTRPRIRTRQQTELGPPTRETAIGPVAPGLSGARAREPQRPAITSSTRRS